jgi:hypothetical protein
MTIHGQAGSIMAGILENVKKGWGGDKKMSGT